MGTSDLYPGTRGASVWFPCCFCLQFSRLESLCQSNQINENADGLNTQSLTAFRGLHRWQQWRIIAGESFWESFTATHATCVGAPSRYAHPKHRCNWLFSRQSVSSYSGWENASLRLAFWQGITSKPTAIWVAFVPSPVYLAYSGKLVAT